MQDLNSVGVVTEQGDLGLGFNEMVGEEAEVVEKATNNKDKKEKE